MACYSQLLLLFLFGVVMQSSSGFVTPPSPRSLIVPRSPVEGKSPLLSPTTKHQQPQGRRRSTTTRLYDFLGSSSGLFGVGGPEIIVILLVGYYVLGPTELFKVTKEVGKFIQQLREVFGAYTSQLEEKLEQDLQLEEMRKASRELNQAFNPNSLMNPSTSTSSGMSTTSETTAEAAAAVGADVPPVLEATATAGGAVVPGTVAALAKNPKKKKKRFKRRKRPKTTEATTTTTSEPAPSSMFPNNLGIPQQDIPQELSAPPSSGGDTMIEADRMSRLEQGPSWFDAFDKETRDRARKLTSNPLAPSSLVKDGYSMDVQDGVGVGGDAATPPPLEDDDPAARFAAQMNGDWNQQVLANANANEDTLMANLMQQLQLLEEEKMAADSRLEEEFRLRGQLEEKYYQEKRLILQDAAEEYQKVAAAAEQEKATTTSMKAEDASTTATDEPAEATSSSTPPTSSSSASAP